MDENRGTSGHYARAHAAIARPCALRGNSVPEGHHDASPTPNRGCSFY